MNNPTASPPPLSPAFKEWDVIVQALASSLQSIIIRKGGISEGREGFHWKHKKFWIFPTAFHQRLEKTKPDCHTLLTPPQKEGCLDLDYVAELEQSFWIEDWNKILTLDSLHFWTQETLKERFDYGEKKGLCIALVRVYRSSPPQTLPMKKEYGGCKSWVDLPCNWSDLSPLFNDKEFEKTKASLHNFLS